MKLIIFRAIADDKLKALAEMGNYGSDEFKDDEISIILHHHLVDNSTLERLIHKLYI
jgi:hypothetical protein